MKQPVYLVTLLTLSSSCVANLTCGPGTLEQDGACIVDETGYSRPGDPNLEGGTTGAENVDENSPAGFTVGPQSLSSHADMTALCQATTVVNGDLTLVGDAIEDTTELGCLTWVHGSLTVQAPGLVALELPELQGVDGDLVVVGTGALRSLDLQKLPRIAGDLRVVLDAWGDTPGAQLILPVLQEVEGDVQLVLAGVSGTLTLPQLATIGGGLHLSDADALTRFEAPALTHTGGDLEIVGTVSLTSISAQMLVQIGGDEGDLVISGNRALSDISELSGLERVGGNLIVTDNPSLPEEQVNRLLHRLGDAGVAGSIQTNP